MIPDTFKTEVKAAVNTFFHAVVAGLAATIPAGLFTSWNEDKVWIMGAAVAGLVAVGPPGWKVPSESPGFPMICGVREVRDPARDPTVPISRSRERRV